MGSVSGLSAAHCITARNLAIEAALLGLRRAPVLHYTQGYHRWDGIAQGLKAWRNECPSQADCSSFATWCLWNGLDHFGVRDTVNGQHWLAGFTGTQADHGWRVERVANVLRADLALYGNPNGRSGHVAIVVGTDRMGRIMVVSFGSERGPLYLSANYRSDLRQYRRYI